MSPFFHDTGDLTVSIGPSSIILELKRGHCCAALFRDRAAAHTEGRGALQFYEMRASQSQLSATTPGLSRDVVEHVMERLA
jgi:hypothetical protein